MKNHDKHSRDITTRVLSGEIEPIKAAYESIVTFDFIFHSVSQSGSAELNEKLAAFKRTHLNFRESEAVILFMMKSGIQIPAEISKLYIITKEEYDAASKIFLAALKEEIANINASRA